jgi:DNA ligase (NAD+)
MKTTSFSGDLDRLKTLRELVEFHRQKYHTHDSPEISDEAYDALLRELKNLKILWNFRTCTREQKNWWENLGRVFKNYHPVPQWSYDNVFGFDELVRWDERNRKILEKADNKLARTNWNYACELKIDGLKII